MKDKHPTHPRTQVITASCKPMTTNVPLLWCRLISQMCSFQVRRQPSSAVSLMSEQMLSGKVATKPQDRMSEGKVAQNRASCLVGPLRLSCSLKQLLPRVHGTGLFGSRIGLHVSKDQLLNGFCSPSARFQVQQ